MPGPVRLPRLALRPGLCPVDRGRDGDGDVRLRIRGEAGDGRRRQLRRQMRRRDSENFLGLADLKINFAHIHLAFL